MQASEHQLVAQRQRRPQPPAYEPPAPVNNTMSGNATLLDPLELESLKLIMDASLRVHARHHFFTWTQGLLQNLVKHEALICALRNAEPMSFHVESFSTSPLEPTLFSDMFRQDTSMVPHLIKTWEESSYQPVVCETGNASPFAESALGRELNRIGADTVIAHGTYDALGKPASFFVFACQRHAIGPRQVYCVELIVPFLQQAWVRTQINRPVEGASAHPAGAGLLTSREQEVLKWIHLGKSNIEIGTILGISPLTVKNHVQKILRKLNVQNRTQAVGKAMALRILNI
jgi:transcriptional regulator EpsA